MKSHQTEVLVVGAGIIGIATGYYLKKLSPEQSVTIVDQLQPMAYTSAQSGENYRNWWPHPIMKKFIEHSIKLMEEISSQTDDRINLTRRGYLLATRKDNLTDLIDEIENSYDSEPNRLANRNLRFHSTDASSHYQPPISSRWQEAPEGVDYLQSQKLIRAHFPSLDPEINNIAHIRNAGMLDSQQMGAFMLERFKEWGGKRLSSKVMDIQKSDNYKVSLDGDPNCIMASKVVNAAGPFANDVAKMLNTSLPVENILQQKIAFPDTQKTIPRNLPFVIDLDQQQIDWQEEDKNALKEDPDFAWLVNKFPGSIHCRPEGGDSGNWVKLGWAFNELPTEALLAPKLHDYYPEIVLRGAARLNPTLKIYYNGLPGKMIHYGGYYTKTKENWPLIGNTEVEGFYVNAAMSGFGTMAACAAGELCAKCVLDLELPEYAHQLSLSRYDDLSFMDELATYNTGIL